MKTNASRKRRLVPSNHFRIFRAVSVTVIVVVFAVLTASVKSSLAQSWSEPDTAPPNPNVAAPIWNQTATVQSGPGSFNIAGSGYIGTNLGVGTSSPSTQLHVYHATSGPIVSLSGVTTVYRGISIKNLSGTEQWFGGADSSNNYVIRRSGSANDIVVNGSGNVGIGNSSPVALLTIGAASRAGSLSLAGNTSGTVTVNVPATVTTSYTLTLPPAAPTANGQALTATTGGVASWTTISGGGGSQTPWISNIDAASYNLTGLGTNLTAAAGLTIASTGAALAINPGSGALTSNATTVTLGGSATMYGGSAASGNMTINSTSNATKGYVILNPTGGNVGIGNSAPGATLSLGTASTRTGTLSLAHASNAYVVTVSPSASTTASYTLTLPPAAPTANGQALTATTGGVASWTTISGGGSQTPWISDINAAGYTLNGNSTSGGNMTINSTSHNNKGYVILNPTGGNVGIGNTGPGQLLTVGASGRQGAIGIAGNTSGVITLTTAAAAGTWTLTLPNNDGDNAQVLTTNGSGVTSWTTVSGGGGAPAGSSGYVQFNNSGAFGGDAGLFWDNTNKRLGIGTATPSQKLDVSGNIKLNTNGTAALFSTFKAASTDGYNLFIGGGGQSSAADGVYTYSGSANTSLGIEALLNNTTGFLNTAIGLWALKANTTGSGNTAVGESALLYNTIGVGNTAIGVNALIYNIDGEENVAVGQSALERNTSGFFNTASGFGALGLNNIGDYNTASGWGALYSNTSGTSNTAIGKDALSYNITGSSNTALGYQAGWSFSGILQTVSNSTFIGSNASSSVDGITNSTAIGYNAQVTASNQVVIGNSSVTQTLLKGDVGINGKVGIGTTTPNNKLQVSGLINFDATLKNVFLGDSAGPGATTAIDDTAVGYAALSQNTDGGRNTAVGAYALQMTAADGIQNTAVGDMALQNNTSGDWNVALGTTALRANTTGGYNTALGNNALAGNTTGAQNTAVGRDALTHNTTGNYNTALGYTAGKNASVTLATLAYDTFIGFGANSSVDGITNSTAIGNGAQVTASNQVVIGNSSVTQILMSGTLGIGVTSPSSSYSLVTSKAIRVVSTDYSSDRRLKTNIATLNDGSGLAVINRLNPVSFNWLDAKNQGTAKQYGFIAQDVQKVLPDLVTKDNAGMLGLKYEGLIAPMVKAIQEQEAKISEQDARIDYLQRQIDELTN
jgi:trimeric autotransporter adhesin